MENGEISNSLIKEYKISNNFPFFSRINSYSELESEYRNKKNEKNRNNSSELIKDFYIRSILKTDFDFFIFLIQKHTNGKSFDITFEQFKKIPLKTFPKISSNCEKIISLDLKKYILFQASEEFLDKLSNNQSILYKIGFNDKEKLDVFCCKHSKWESLKFLMKIDCINFLDKCLEYISKRDLNEAFQLLWNFKKRKTLSSDFMLYNNIWIKKLFLYESITILESNFKITLHDIHQTLQDIIINDKSSTLKLFLKHKLSKDEYERCLKFIIIYDSRNCLKVFLDSNILNNEQISSFYNKLMDSSTCLGMIKNILKEHNLKEISQNPNFNNIFYISDNNSLIDF
jgi:hypothetical protein